MKRLVAFTLTLTLLLTLCAGGSAAKMVQTFSTEYFNIYIPGDWIIDTSSAEDYFGALDLGYMYSPDLTMLIESYLFFYGDWSQDSLWTGNEESWADYEEFILDDLKEENPEIIAKVMAGQYPGLLVRATNEAGTYLYGEIMINAYAYGFYFYLLNEDDTVNSNITEEEIELFTSILETFTPAY